MSGSLGEAVLDLNADSTLLEKGIANAKGNALNMLSGLSNVGGAIVKAGMAAAVAGTALLAKGLYDSVQAAMASEVVQAQLDAVLRSTGGAAGVSAEQVNELATNLSQMTMFDDEAIVSAESMLLTFTNIGSDVFPQATATVLDMSQALGQDLQSSAIQLGKALQDPILGVTALRRVGVNFSDAQKKVIEKLVKTGKLEEAQALILKELQTEFGGSAKAAGETFAGKLKILQTNMGNVQETIGNALLPALSDFIGLLNDFLSRPEMKAMLADVVKGLGDFAKKAVDNIPKAIKAFKNLVTWFQNNEGVIVGILAALGVAVAAFAYTTIVPLLPVIAVMALIGAAAYLLYRAWTENWGGIQEKMAAVWAWLQPILQNVWTWIQTNLPIAIQTLVTFWNTQLLPAIINAWTWINANLVPVLVNLYNWLAVNIPAAIAGMSAFWTSTLLPAIQAVWSWMNGTLFPFLRAIANFISTAFGLAVTAMAGAWENIFLPTLLKAGAILSTQLMPIFKKLADFFKGTVLPVVKDVAKWVGGALNDAFKTLNTIIKNITTAINTMTDALANIELPDALTPGSPTPFETGLWGIHDALRSVASMSLPTLTTQMQASSAGFAGGGFAMANAGAQQGAGAGGGNTFYAPVTFEVKDRKSFDELMRTLRTS